MHVKLYNADGNYITSLKIANTNLSVNDRIYLSGAPLDFWLYVNPFDFSLLDTVNGIGYGVLGKIGYAGIPMSMVSALYFGGNPIFSLYTKSGHELVCNINSPAYYINANGGRFNFTTGSAGTFVSYNSYDGLFYPLRVSYTTGSGEYSYNNNIINWVEKNATNSTLNLFMSDWEKDATDPYEDGGVSDEGGGGGNFDDTSDPIETPSIPSISALTSKFVSMYNPTVGQLASLSDYMWLNPLFDVDNWKKLFADPMDAILGLSIVPVQPQTSGVTAVKIGNLSTDIEMARVSSQFVEIDCGTLNIEEYWGAYLDYSPYTKIEIYLPYCGTHSLDTDDVMGKSVNVKYHIDILSGACCAYIIVSGTVLYTFTGQCSCSLPITSNNMADIMRGALNVATSLGSMVASGGMSAPSVMGAIGSISSTVMSSKPHIEKSGSVNGTAGLLAVQKPYLIINRPNQCLPKGQNEYLGYPSFITKKVSDLAGYTQFADIHLINMSATDSEKDELMSLMKGGVIL